MRRFVRSVIENATVTAGGSTRASLRLDRVLMDALEVRPFEAVEVVNTAGGQRFATWIEEGEYGEVSVPQVRTGDLVTIISHGFLHDGQTLAHKVRVVTVSAQNELVSIVEA